MAAIAVRLAEAWALAAALQLVLWLVQQRTRNAALADVGWALGFVPIVMLFAADARTPITDWGPIAALVLAWSLRLGGYLLARRPTGATSARPARSCRGRR